MLKWRIGSNLKFRSWSCGAVKTKGDLYSAKIFGPSRDHRCECGRFIGARHVCIICDRCGVKVVSDAAKVRRQRLGHVALHFSCDHPMQQPPVDGFERTEDSTPKIDEFPVAPIGFRMHADGTPNLLGLKYEALLATRDRLAADAPAKGTAEWHRFEQGEAYKGPLQACLADIVGKISSVVEGDQPGAGTLLYQLFSSILRMDESFDALVKALGCEIYSDVLDLDRLFHSETDG